MFRTLLSNNTNRRATLYALLVVAIVSCLTLIDVYSGEYKYGFGNQGEVIPIHMRLENPDYLSEDYLVNSLQQYNVRTNFSYFMYLNRIVTFGVFDYPAIYLFYYIAVSFFSMLGIYFMTEFFSRSKAYRLCILVLTMITPMISIGGTYLFTRYYRELLPSSFAALFMIWAVYFFLKKRYFTTFFLLALATCFHVLIGILSAIIFGVALIYTLRLKKKKKIVLIIGMYGLLSLPFLMPPIVDMVNSGTVDSDRVAYIIAFFRNPHHYVPSTWDVGPVIRFFVLELIAVALLFTNPIKKSRYLKVSLLIFFLITNLMFLVGYVFVDVYPVSGIIKLQIFRISILNDLIIRIILISSLFYYLHTLFSKRIHEHVVRIGLCCIFVIFIISVAIWKFPNYGKFLYYKQIPPFPEQMNAIEWIKRNTSDDSVFITSISDHYFRLQAERAVVINFKQFVFRDADVLEWYSRIEDLCGMEKPACVGWDCVEYCRLEFLKYTEDDMLYLDQKYGADYVFTTTGHELSFSKVYEDQGYTIYKLPPNEE